MDLIRGFPRSPRERLAGLTMLARTIDKGRAQLAGALGEYYFNCPMDRQLFAVLAVTADEFLDAVRRSPDDQSVVAWLHERGSLPVRGGPEAHNGVIETWAPKSDEGRARFAAQRAVVAPGRTDVTTWTDLIDIEEGRAALPAG